MRPTERDLMVARAVREDCAAKCTRGDAQRLLATDLTALIESLPEPAEQPRCRCGWVSVEGGEIIDPFCPVHDVPVEHEQAAQDAPSNLVGHRRGHLGIAATPLAFDPGPREATTAEIDRLEAGSMKALDLLREHGRDPIAAARAEGYARGKQDGMREERDVIAAED